MGQTRYSLPTLTNPWPPQETYKTALVKWKLFWPSHWQSSSKYGKILKLLHLTHSPYKHLQKNAVWSQSSYFWSISHFIAKENHRCLTCCLQITEYASFCPSFRSSSRCRQNFNLSNLNQKWRSPLDFCLMLFFPFRVFRFFSFSQVFSRLYLSVKSFSRKLQELWKYFEGSKGG